MKLSLLFFLSLLTFGFLAAPAQGQSLPEPRQSPLGLSRAMLGDVYVKVIYGRPYARDREIFGSLVPFGEVWRTGANEATEITFTGGLTIADHSLEAGTYSLFTIPGDDEWTIIINQQLGQWGSYGYNREYDVVRFNVPRQRSSEYNDLFTISIDKSNDTTGYLVIEWERTRIEIPLSK
ncbi:MAG: DUF2911 domain-containing protein [Balneolia bacterium]|nr:DUF2911 domain-containing protein [Balneolia bacterium]